MSATSWLLPACPTLSPSPTLLRRTTRSPPVQTWARILDTFHQPRFLRLRLRRLPACMTLIRRACWALVMDPLDIPVTLPWAFFQLIFTPGFTTAVRSLCCVRLAPQVPLPPAARYMGIGRQDRLVDTIRWARSADTTRSARSADTAPADIVRRVRSADLRSSHRDRLLAGAEPGRARWHAPRCIADFGLARD